MKKKLTTILIAALLCVCTAAGTCGTVRSVKARAEELVIKIGLLTPLTGANAMHGLRALKIIKMQIDEINAAGGVLSDFQLAVYVYDTQSDPNYALSAYQQHLSNEVDAIIVADTISCGMAIWGAASSNDIPTIIINPVEQNYVLPNLFHANSRPDTLATTFANVVFNTLEYQNMGILYDSNNGQMNILANAFMGMGGNVISTQQTATGNTDFAPQLAAIKNSDPDCLVLVGYTGPYLEMISKQRMDLGMDYPIIVYEERAQFIFDNDPRNNDFIQRYCNYTGEGPDDLNSIDYILEDGDIIICPTQNFRCGLPVAIPLLIEAFELAGSTNHISVSIALETVNYCGSFFDYDHYIDYVDYPPTSLDKPFYTRAMLQQCAGEWVFQSYVQ